MRKPSNKFFEILFEAIKKRNPYGIDKQGENVKQLFLKPYDEPDYSYHGGYSTFKPSRGQDFLTKNSYAELRKKRAKIKSGIKKIEGEADQPVLFDTTIDTKRLTEMQIDMRNLTHEIDAIKKVKQESTSYTKFLRKILTSFFMIPGASMARRYVFLPLKRNFTMTQIAALNKKNTVSADMIEDLVNKNEVVKDKQIDMDLIRYLKSFDYVFKTDDDLYNNICYTKKGAKVKISDELAKINAISITDKEASLKNSKDIKKDFFIQREIDKKRMLKPEFIKRIDIIESEIFQTDKRDDISVIVLTWVPRMIMSQSTETIWKSCMSLPSAKAQGGSNMRFVKSGIENGVFIAWLVNIGDIKNIDKPKARILIKPFKSEKNYVWLPSHIYHDGSVSNDLQIFKQAVNTFCFLKQKSILMNAAKREIKFNVDGERVYSDTGDANKKIITLKEMFKKIANSSSMIKTSEANFYDAVDFTTIKAMAYLKKLKKEALLRNIHPLMSNTLRNQNITIFNYLVGVSEQESLGAIDYYFSEIIFEQSVKESFFSFLLKYYFDKVQMETRQFLLNKLFQKNQTEKIIYFIKNDPSVFFDKNNKKLNLHVLTNVLMTSVIYKGATGLTIALKFIEALMKKIKISDYFDLNETINSTNVTDIFARIDSADLSAEDEKIWQSFTRELESTNSSEFMIFYLNNLMQDYFAYGEKPKRFTTRYVNYVKTLVERDYIGNKDDTNNDFIINISDYIIQNRDGTKEIVQAIKNKIQSDNPTKINLAINLQLEQKEFEKNMNIIFSKTKSAELFNDLFRIIKNKFAHMSYSSKNLEIDETKKIITDIENKMTFILNNRGNIKLDKKQISEFILLYIDYSPFINKDFLTLLDAKNSVTEDLIMEYIGLNYISYLVSMDKTEMFINKIKALMNIINKKTLDIKNNSYADRMFFGVNTNMASDNEMVSKLLTFLLEIFDFKQITNYIIKKVKDTKIDDFDRIRAQREAVNSLYFDLKHTKIVEEFVKSKVKLQANFMQNVLAKTISKAFSTFSMKEDKLIEELLKDKQLCKNIRDFFHNDFDYAIKTIVHVNMTLESNNYYQSIYALRIAFNISEEDFLEMPVFKLLLKKPSERIFGFLPKANKQSLEKYIIENIDDLSVKQKMRLKFIKYIESQKDYMDLGQKRAQTEKTIRNEMLQFYKDLDFSVDNMESNLDMTDNILVILSRNNFKDIDDIEGFGKRTADIINNKFDEETKMSYDFHMEFYNLKDSFVEAIKELRGEKEKEKRFRQAYHDYLHAYVEKYLNFSLRNNSAKPIVTTLTSKNNVEISLLVSIEEKLNNSEKQTLVSIIKDLITKFELIKINYKIEEKTKSET